MTSPDLASMSSTDLLALLEDAQQAYVDAIEREQQAAQQAQAKLRGLAGQLEGHIKVLGRIAQLTDQELDGPGGRRAIRTLATGLAQVAELGRQSVLLGAQQV